MGADTLTTSAVLVIGIPGSRGAVVELSFVEITGRRCSSIKHLECRPGQWQSILGSNCRCNAPQSWGSTYLWLSGNNKSWRGRSRAYAATVPEEEVRFHANLARPMWFGYFQQIFSYFKRSLPQVFGVLVPLMRFDQVNRLTVSFLLLPFASGHGLDGAQLRMAAIHVSTSALYIFLFCSLKEKSMFLLDPTVWYDDSYIRRELQRGRIISPSLPMAV